MPLSESIIGLRYEDQVRGEMAPSESFMRNAVMVRYRNSADGNCETVKFFTSGIHVSSRKTVVEAEPIAMAVLAAIAAICPAEIECYELTMLRWNGELLRPVKRLQLADLLYRYEVGDYFFSGFFHNQAKTIPAKLMRKSKQKPKLLARLQIDRKGKYAISSKSNSDAELCKSLFEEFVSEYERQIFYGAGLSIRSSDTVSEIGVEDTEDFDQLSDL